MPTSGADGPSAPLTGVAPAVRFVIAGRVRALSAMTLTAFLGGVAEAFFLVAVTRTAFAITDENDRVDLVAGRTLSVNQALVAALGLVLVRVCLAALTTWQLTRLSSHVVARTRLRLAAAFLNATWEAQQAAKAGSLQELQTTYAAQASGLMGAVSQGLVAVANLVALLVIAIAVDPVGALVLSASVVILGLVLRPLRSLVRRRAGASAAAGMELATAVNEISVLGVELHVFDVQSPVQTHLAGLIERFRERQRKLTFTTALSTPIYTGLGYVALLAALAIVASSESTDLASVAASMLVMLRSMSYGQAVQTAHVNISSAAPLLDELQTRLAQFERARVRHGGRPVGRVGSLTADSVTFSYSPGTPVLRGVSFVIDPFEVVGMVGPSGGGKSTLVHLLLGLREPQQGRILADGRPITSFDRAEWARKVTFVPQTPHLISGSIEENIRFFRADVSKEQIEEAARRAHLHEDTLGLPGAYGYEVGDHGGRLSGGQQQRLCLARALVEDPDIMILDEPTSALDVRTEHLVRTTLVELKARMTVIVIAHRLSTLDICDRIMVIQDGVLRGFDTPQGLERSSSFYREALALSGLR